MTKDWDDFDTKGNAPFKVFQTCINLLREALEEEGEVPVKVQGLREQFKSLVAQFQELVRLGRVNPQVIGLGNAGANSSSVDQLATAIMTGVEERKEPATLDDLSPNLVKQMLSAMIDDIAGQEGDVLLCKDLFSKVFAHAKSQKITSRRIYSVYSNFDRMNGYLQELMEVDGRATRFGNGKRYSTAKVRII